MDYCKDLKGNDFRTDDDPFKEKVKRGVKAGYTFKECYNHCLVEKEKAKLQHLPRLEREYKASVQKASKTCMRLRTELYKMNFGQNHGNGNGHGAFLYYCWRVFQNSSPHPRLYLILLIGKDTLKQLKDNIIK